MISMQGKVNSMIVKYQFKVKFLNCSFYKNYFQGKRNQCITSLN